MAKQIDIGKEIGRGWQLFKGNMGLLILVNLLAGVLAIFTCGILAGAMMAGNFLIIQRLLKNDPVKPQVGDVFKGFEHFVNALIYIIVMMVIAGVAGLIPVLNAIVGYVVGVFISIGVMFIAFGKMSFSDTLKKVFSEAATGPFWMLVLTVILANVIASLGMLACGIGVLFTAPLATCIAVCAYHAAYEGADAEQPQTPPAAPPLVDQTPPPPMA